MFNGTNCDAPINPIATRAILGIVSSVLFAIGIMLGLTLLRKHGATHLPVEKRFRLVSRRWQWYWLICTAVCGMISGFMAIDVDRNYLQSTALIMQSIFFYVMLPAMLASVWEMTRHWYVQNYHSWSILTIAVGDHSWSANRLTPMLSVSHKTTKGLKSNSISRWSFICSDSWLVIVSYLQCILTTQIETLTFSPLDFLHVAPP